MGDDDKIAAACAFSERVSVEVIELEDPATEKSPRSARSDREKTTYRLAQALDHGNDGAAYYADKVVEPGMVDFLVGAAPSNGAFVIGYSTDPLSKDYLKYLKMGEGPYYVFYTPFHLPQLEIPNTIARAALFRDATVAPIGPPMCESVAIAKRDLPDVALPAGRLIDELRREQRARFAPSPR